jgi:hypothetical protein
MAMSLREAAQQAGVNKSSIFRAIKAGRLSAGRTDDGDYAIDPAELMRVYPPKPGPAAEQPDARQDATAETTELRVRNARLEAEVSGLRELLSEMTRTRDAFERQVTALTASLPKPVASSEPVRRSWLPWRRAG